MEDSFTPSAAALATFDDDLVLEAPLSAGCAAASDASATSPFSSSLSPQPTTSKVPKASKTKMEPNPE
jgi:hypothetical protein